MDGHAVIALLALSVLAAEPVDPYYETRDLGLRWRGEADDLRPHLMTELQERKLKAWRQLPDGSLQKAGFFAYRLSIDSMAAGVVVIANNAVGAEFDGMIGVKPGEELRPVTVRWEDGRMVFIEGEPTDVVIVPGPDPLELVGRFGFAGIEAKDGRSWDHLASGLLMEALDRLSPAELAGLADVWFWREAAWPWGGQEKVTASHELRDGVSRIAIYDAAFQPSTRFVGEPDAARPWVLAVLLHEIGHALAFTYEYERQEAIDAVQAQQIEARNDGDSARVRALVDTAIRLDALGLDRTPPADALLHTLGNRPPPTWYARTGPEESFAECFALYHADRAALERVAPEAVAFFDDGLHLAALDAARADIEALLAGITPPASP